MIEIRETIEAFMQRVYVTGPDKLSQSDLYVLVQIALFGAKRMVTEFGEGALVPEFVGPDDNTELAPETKSA